MKLFRYQAADGARVGMETDEGRFDLRGLSPHFNSIGAWLGEAQPATLARIASRNAAAFDAMRGDVVILPPVDGQMEVWAAGVTYERSKVARQEESEGGGDFYDRVYHADRPELFFKSPAYRVVGPDAPVRIRRDSTWNVPEPEMTLIVSAGGQIVGVTVGNDMSSRSIEGENPLYLPQAKTYDGACALGPAILVVEDPAILRDLPIRLEIQRDGATAWEGETSTARMKRTPEELAAYLFRETAFPHGAALMTGTGLVPPDSFTLQPGDTVHITLGDVGTLVNTVA